VPAKNLVATGYGQHHPIASNKSASGRARNRRIEILLTPSLDPKAMAKSKLRAAEAEALAQADTRPEPVAKSKTEAPAKSKMLVSAKSKSEPAKSKQAKSGGKKHR
jgi:hypothetical protein